MSQVPLPCLTAKLGINASHHDDDAAIFSILLTIKVWIKCSERTRK